MNSNPALGLLGFWMMLQLAASLALLIGGIYVLFCLGRAASGLDRMANAMEDWIALQTVQTQPNLPQKPAGYYDTSTPPAPIPAVAAMPFTPTSSPTQTAPFQSPTQPQTQPPTEYSASDESARL